MQIKNLKNISVVWVWVNINKMRYEVTEEIGIGRLVNNFKIG